MLRDEGTNKLFIALPSWRHLLILFQVGRIEMCVVWAGGV